MFDTPSIHCEILVILVLEHFFLVIDISLNEGSVKRGDYGVMMTMGPGSTIETALLKW